MALSPHLDPPYFLWGNRDVEIEIFERDLKVRSRFKISSEIECFLIVGPSGKVTLERNADDLGREFWADASFLLTVEVFLLTVRLLNYQWGNRK